MAVKGKIAGILGISTGATAVAGSEQWPILPSHGFISERTAEQSDVDQGNAVFSMSGTSLGPLGLNIPQYVIWTDEKQIEHPMILVQAEKARNGMEIVGLKAFDGKETVATLKEIKLLGTKKPN